MRFNQEFFLYVYNLLFEKYGDMKWWPAETPFEVVIGAILTQNTSWNNVEKSIENLKKFNLIEPHKIVSSDDSFLKELIKPSGFFNQKVERLKIISKFIIEKCNGDIRYLNNLNTTTARKELLFLKGVGFETADSILLYACDHPIFVIDKYTMRMFKRIGLDWKEKYEIFQKGVMENTPKDLQLYRNYHALIVENSKKHCKIKVDCSGCPLEKICNKNIM